MANLTYTLSPNNSTDLTYTFTQTHIGSGQSTVDFTTSASASIDNPCLYPFITTPSNNLTYVFSSGGFIGISASGTGSIGVAGIGTVTIDDPTGGGVGELNVSGIGTVTIDDPTGSGSGQFLEYPVGSGSVIIDVPVGDGSGINLLYGSGAVTLDLTGTGSSTFQPPVTGSGSPVLDLTGAGDADLSDPVVASGNALTELSALGSAYQTPSSVIASATTELSGSGGALSSESIEASGSLATELFVSGFGAIKVEGSGAGSIGLVVDSEAWFAEYYGGGSATTEAPFNNGTGVGIVTQSQASKFVRPVTHIPATVSSSKILTTCSPLSNVGSTQNLTKCANVESTSAILHVCHTYPTILIKGEIYCNPLSNSEDVYNQECIPSRALSSLNSNDCFDVSEVSNPYLHRCMPTSSVVGVGNLKHIPLEESGIVGDIVCSKDVEAVSSVTTRCMVHYETIYPLQGISEFIPPVVIPPVVIPPIQPATVVIIEKDTYTVNNNISMMLEDGTLLGVQNINLSSDANGHSWSCSATLNDVDQRGLIRPKEDGSLVTVIVTVNQYVWYLLVEKITTNRRFNQDGISIQCRGLSAELALPYVPNTDVAINQVQTNQQVAEQLIPTDTGVWVIDWELPIWNLPANTYEHRDISPISALLQLVTNCGGMLVPHRNQKRFTAKPRYPVLPWNFSTTPPDYEIADKSIFTITEQPTAKAGANGVYISGQTNGVQGLVRLTGTSGSELATTTTNIMMTDPDALRSLGERLLSGAQPQPIISSIETWCDGEVVPLFEVGEFIRITIDGVNTEGVVNGIALTCTNNNDVIEVSQRITIGEATNNQYELFKELLPSNPLSIVTILSTLNGKSRVRHIDGAEQVVRGSGIVGGSYYLKDGQLLNATANVPVVAEVVI